MIDWPWGRRALVGSDSTTELPADYPVEYWICCRVDEPWTWKPMTQQFLGDCVRCGAGIIYRKSELSPTNPGVQKICKRCAEALITEGKPR